MTANSSPQPAPGPSLGRRFGIRLLAVVVLAVLVGAGWVLFRPAGDQALSSYGAPVANGPGLLAEAERALHQTVRARHGVLAPGARCYYESTGPVSRRSAPQPIGDQIFCGPVRFVDGPADRPFLAYNLVAGAQPDGRMRLALADEAGDGTSTDPRPAVRLFRPDGASPPSSDEVSAPVPPAAAGDLLTTAATLPAPITPAPADAQMAGQVSGVRLVEYGFVDSYGYGDTARVAPKGFRLLAFATASRPGEADDRAPDLSVRVDGQEQGPLTATSDYIVTAVPDTAQQVDLVLTDSGLKQSISLLTGQPAATNLAVPVRTHTRQELALSRSVRVQVRTGAGTGTVPGTLQLRQLSLSYWAADGRPARSSDRAWLHLGAVLQLSGDKQFYGVEASLLSVTLPGQAPVAVTNAAGDPTTGVDDVVDVPARVTNGTIRFAGTARTAKGTLTVLSPVELPFRLPAG